MAQISARNSDPNSFAANAWKIKYQVGYTPEEISENLAPLADHYEQDGIKNVYGFFLG
jgi:hypothetical protein